MPRLDFRDPEWRRLLLGEEEDEAYPYELPPLRFEAVDNVVRSLELPMHGCACCFGRMLLPWPACMHCCLEPLSSTPIAGPGCQRWAARCSVHAGTGVCRPKHGLPAPQTLPRQAGLCVMQLSMRSAHGCHACAQVGLLMAAAEAAAPRLYTEPGVFQLYTYVPHYHWLMRIRAMMVGELTYDRRTGLRATVQGVYLADSAGLRAARASPKAAHVLRDTLAKLRDARGVEIGIQVFAMSHTGPTGTSVPVYVKPAPM